MSQQGSAAKYGGSRETIKNYLQIDTALVSTLRRRMLH